MYFNMKFTEDLTNSTEAFFQQQTWNRFAQSMWHVTTKTAKGAASCVRRQRKQISTIYEIMTEKENNAKIMAWFSLRHKHKHGNNGSDDALNTSRGASRAKKSLFFLFLFVCLCQVRTSCSKPLFLPKKTPIIRSAQAYVLTLVL